MKTRCEKKEYFSRVTNGHWGSPGGEGKVNLIPSPDNHQKGMHMLNEYRRSKKS